MRARGLAILAAAGALAAAPVPPPGRISVRPPDEIEFHAVVNTAGFERRHGMPGYHAIVWKGGRAADDALLEADVTDVDVLNALESIGGRPGDNVPMDAWEKRTDPGSAAPDAVVRGTSVEILLKLPGRNALVPLSSVLEDPGGRGLDMRLGGNRANISAWKSGCIACLYSCPGSKVGNARYTERDYVRGRTRFSVRPGALPPDGTRIGVVLRLLTSGP